MQVSAFQIEWNPFVALFYSNRLYLGQLDHLKMALLGLAHWPLIGFGGCLKFLVFLN